MSISIGAWQDVAIASSGTTSAEVDLGGDCDYVQITIPTITAATVSLQVAEDSGGTFYTLGASISTASGTGNYCTTFVLGGYQFIKVVCSAAQGSARTFRVRGRRS